MFYLDLGVIDMMLKDRQAKPYTELGRKKGSRNLWITGAEVDPV
jgi:hypothetical protein